MNVCFETFGCRLNRAEALEDEAKCLAAGHKVVTDREQADIFIVRGCSVTSRAQHDCEKLIDHLREKYPTRRIQVTGCLPSAKPFVIRRRSDDEVVPTRTARAYLKVQNGCSGRCTFCIVPKFRGTGSVSEGFLDVIDRAKRFIDVGYREIVMTGCNLSLYASDGRRLPELLSALAELDPGCRIRLGSLEPCTAADDVLSAMAEHPNVCRFLHMPIQSGSDRILRRMNRPYDVDRVVQLLLQARRLMPTVALGCDMIAGFPGECDLDQINSESLLNRLKIVNVHAFPFSRRPGTAAAAFPLQLPHGTITERARKLANIGTTYRRAFAHRFVGQTVDVIVEKEDAAAGWTGEHLWFEETADGRQDGRRNERRQAVRFLVQKAHDGRLYGTRV